MKIIQITDTHLSPRRLISTETGNLLLPGSRKPILYELRQLF